MTTTVFTPIHKPEFDKLRELYDSLTAQTVRPTEWVIVRNGAMIDVDIPFEEDWIKVHNGSETGNIGWLKRYACQMATGEILIEVDYDDQLIAYSVEKIVDAFQNDRVQFVYSNCVEYREDGTYNLYGEQYGWRSRPFGEMRQQVAFPARPQYLRRIEWAPNHVRAFRATAYEKVGGHDPEIKVGDDHDLICRFYIEYGEDGFHHIDECLYLYRVHAGNTCNGNNRNAEIQVQVDRNYIRHAEKMYLRWAKDNSLACLDLGGRIGCPVGYKSVDLLDADIVADLNQKWPFADDSVGVLRAYHLIEHLPDTVHFFNEAYRVLAPGGFLLIEVPSVNGAGAFGDPTHVRFFNTLSFEYFTKQQFARFIQPRYTGRFQKARLVEYGWSNGIPVISAQLIALKGWYDENWCGQKEI